MKSQPSISSPETNDLLFRVQGGYGWITLNREKALNALSFEMIQGLAAQLAEWEQDPTLQAVIIEGAGEKAFCAGGDVRAVYEAKQQGNLSLCDAFFRQEYTLNAHINTYKKPFIALLDGIAMGGGLGVSINGSHRVVTEKALLAMPETAIGFFPDVGATTFLNDIPGIIGLYLGLTGHRLPPEDALWTGLATHYIPHSSLPLFKESLSRGTSLEKSLEAYSEPYEKQGFLETHQEEINEHFNKSSLRKVFDSLEKDLSAFANTTLQNLLTKSPTSLAVVFRQLRDYGPVLTFAERMQMEFRLSQRFVAEHDFSEGIRAVLIDKDQTPRWKPDSIKDISTQTIEAYFSPLEGGELTLEGDFV